MENLRKLRVEKQLTQIAIQMETGIDQSLLSKYERNERMPTVEDLMALAKLLHTSLDYLMDLTDEREPYPRRK